MATSRFFVGQLVDHLKFGYRGVVFGVDSDKWGVTPVAAIVLQSGSDVTAEALKDWINQRVEARFQKVSDVYIVDQMPRNVAGKTLKNELKENYLANQK